MAVYKQNYKRYDGPITDRRWRFTILPRYAFQNVFETRFFVVFYVGCFVPSLVALAAIYLRANIGLLQSAGLGINIRDFVPIDSTFFFTLFRVQTFLTFILGMFVGPG